MTHKQFVHVAENFVGFAGKSVTFKMYVPHISKTSITETATLVGVGVFEKAETLVLRWDSGFCFNVHYRKIAYPGE